MKKNSTVALVAAALFTFASLTGGAMGASLFTVANPYRHFQHQTEAGGVWTEQFDGCCYATSAGTVAMSIAAYDPWIHNHANPEQVWKMFRQTGGRYLVPIHWGTFRLSKEPMDEPMRRLLAAAGPAANRVAIRQIGVPWTLPQSNMRQVSIGAAR